jgi:hypothetical protein
LFISALTVLSSAPILFRPAELRVSSERRKLLTLSANSSVCAVAVFSAVVKPCTRAAASLALVKSGKMLLPVPEMPKAFSAS